MANDHQAPEYLTVQEVENGYVIMSNPYRNGHRRIVARDRLAVVQIIAGLFGVDFDETPKMDAPDAE